ncbi:hypothetical protein KIL84_007986 [Mauremys mutica]|uniref:Integrin alpha-X-like third Ig-like domain-containing protein n=1 Tax=Mauremys mutica TaxID=74926 RepID=A0A9D3X455_9SAUR|nr:hypothetical protein KIL84_007986 [Mauremys mutica]
MDPLPLLLYLCTVLAPSRGFSVDVEGPITFQEAAAGFGQSMLQFGSASDGGLIIGAPLQTGNVNETGKVYKCDPGSGHCQEIPTQSYSSQVITAKGQSIYMVGAPLCQGTGKVVLFSRDTKGGEWTPGPELLGDQLCPEDTLTPITLRFNYTLTGEPIAAAGGLRPILSEDSVLVSAGSSNRRAVAVKCSSAVGSEEQTQRNSTCHINHPIFWSGAELSACISSHLSPLPSAPPSDNGGLITERMMHRAELPVKYGNFIIPTSLEESTKYVSFSAKAAGTSVPVTHRYEVKNLRQQSIPISVTFQFPVELNGVRVWDASEVVPSKPQLAQCNSESETPGSKDFVKQMSKRPLLDCSVATCKKIRCRIASLETQQSLEFMIKGNVSFQWVSQTQQQKVSLVSEARIEYEEEKYTQKEGFIRRQVQTVVERSEVYNYLPIVVGSSVGGLVLLALITAALYKFGFFKHQYKQMVEGEGPHLTQSVTAGNPPASDTPKQ